MILDQKFPVSSSASYWGKLYLPDDYNATSEQHPLMVFCHGIGERGGTQQALAMLNSQGPFRYINAGNKMEFNNPVDGKKHRFIFLALQDPEWSPSASEIGYCLINHIFPNYRINRSCVSITGLSAGGDSTLRTITQPGVLELFCAAIPMSSASSGNTNNIAATAMNKTWVWQFHGNADTVCPLQNSLTFDAKLNAAAPGTCRTFVYTGGHGLWENYYNPSYRSDIWGKSMNMYEFALASMKNGGFAPSPPPSAAVKAEFDIQDGAVINATTMTVDASASDNVRTDWQGYQWGLRPIRGGSWGAQPVGGAYGGPFKQFKDMTDGIYELSLTVMDNFNRTNTTAINFTVALGTTPEPPDPPATKKMLSTTYTPKGMVNVFDDATTEVK